MVLRTPGYWDRIAVFKTRLRVVDEPSALRKHLYGRQVVFHLAEEAKPYVETISSLPFINHSEAINNKLLLSLENPEDENPEIIRTLVAANANIQFVGELRHSLEEVYLQLVNEE